MLIVSLTKHKSLATYWSRVCVSLN